MSKKFVVLTMVILSGCAVPRGSGTRSDFTNVPPEIRFIQISNAISENSDVIRFNTNNSNQPKIEQGFYFKEDIVSSDDTLLIKITEPVFGSPGNSLIDRSGLNNFIVKVDENGRVDLPYVSGLKVGGKTLSLVKNAITNAYKKKVVNPQVVVSKVESPSSYVNLFGDISNVGVFKLTNVFRDLRSIIPQVVGEKSKETEFNVSIIRSGKNIYNVTSSELARGSGNFNLMPQDSLELKSLNNSFTLFGAVGTPGLFKLGTHKTSLLDALALAKGLNDDLANPEAVYVLRVSNNFTNKPEIIHANLRDMNDLVLTKKFTIVNGDAIFVANANFADTKKVLSVFSSTLGIARLLHGY